MKGRGRVAARCEEGSGNETGDMLVVTVPVPTRKAAELSVSWRDRSSVWSGRTGSGTMSLYRTAQTLSVCTRASSTGSLQLRAPGTDHPASTQARGVPVCVLV